jgi:hypothetical protein
MSKISFGKLIKRRNLIEIYDEKGTYIQRFGHNEGPTHLISYPEAFFLLNNDLLSIDEMDFRFQSIISFGIFRLLVCYLLFENGLTCSSEYSSQIISVNLDKNRICKSKSLCDCLLETPETNFFQTLEKIGAEDLLISINIPQSQIFFHIINLNPTQLYPQSFPSFTS